MAAEITFTQGDILESDATAIVNTVNCVGVMGRGIALQFKRAHPQNFKAYEAACKRGEVQPGRMFVFETDRLQSPRFIINFPTKRHWRGKSRMEDIESGLAALVKVIGDRGIGSIALPPLGSGMGGLNWPDVKKRIVAALRPLDGVRVFVYEPTGAREPMREIERHTIPTMTPGRAVLVELMGRYLAGLLDPFVTLLEVHKLMYFMQVAGEPLKLNFTEGLYGPYAENLRHVLRAIDGYFITGYAEGGDAPGKPLELVPGAIDDAKACLATHGDTRARFERVATLVEGFESPFGLELLATVHWVMTKPGCRDIDEVVSRTYAWGPRKRQFTKRQIAIAVATLQQQQWGTLPDSGA